MEQAVLPTEADASSIDLARRTRAQAPRRGDAGQGSSHRIGPLDRGRRERPQTAPPNSHDMSRSLPNSTARTAIIDGSARSVCAALAAIWILLAIMMPARGLSLVPEEIIVAGLLCFFLGLLGNILRSKNLPAAATAVESYMLLALASLTLTLFSFLMATSAMPLADEAMARADRVIAPGLDWRETMLAVVQHPWPMAVANFAYASIRWQGPALILVCCLSGRAPRCSAFILRWIIAITICCVIFALVPCLGAYEHFGITHRSVLAIHSNVGWHQPVLLKMLRSGTPIRVHLSMLDGIIQFPSFHTAAAILFAWGFWPSRWLRWPMLGLNLTMIASSMPIGGHYYVDVLGGAIVAWASIKLPTWTSRLPFGLTAPGRMAASNAS